MPLLPKVSLPSRGISFTSQKPVSTGLSRCGRRRSSLFCRWRSHWSRVGGDDKELATYRSRICAESREVVTELTIFTIYPDILCRNNVLRLEEIDVHTATGSLKPGFLIRHPRPGKEVGARMSCPFDMFVGSVKDVQLNVLNTIRCFPPVSPGRYHLFDR